MSSRRSTLASTSSTSVPDRHRDRRLCPQRARRPKGVSARRRVRAVVHDPRSREPSRRPRVCRVLDRLASRHRHHPCRCRQPGRPRGAVIGMGDPDRERGSRRGLPDLHLSRSSPGSGSPPSGRRTSSRSRYSARRRSRSWSSDCCFDGVADPSRTVTSRGDGVAADRRARRRRGRNAAAAAARVSRPAASRAR